MVDDLRVLDLLDYDYTNIAHANEDVKKKDSENNTKPEKGKDTKKERGKEIEVEAEDQEEDNEEDEDSEEERKIDIIELTKWAFAGLGAGFLVYQVLKPRRCNHQVNQGDSNQQQQQQQQLMMNLLFLIYQANLQMMSSNNNNNNNNHSCDHDHHKGRDRDDDRSDLIDPENDPHDWMEFYQENYRDNHVQDVNEPYPKAEMRINEDWKVERDLKGQIKNVYRAYRWTS